LKFFPEKIFSRPIPKYLVIGSENFFSGDGKFPGNVAENFHFWMKKKKFSVEEKKIF